MKMMDSSTEDSDCIVQVIVPLKPKKLKQAQLPFQRVHLTDTPKNSTSKKRKLSPSVDCKSTKIIKTTVKENLEEDIELDNTESNANDKANETDSDIEVEVCVGNEKIKHVTNTIYHDEVKSLVTSLKKNVSSKDSKKNSKIRISSGSLTKFLTKEHKNDRSQTVSKNSRAIQNKEITHDIENSEDCVNISKEYEDDAQEKSEDTENESKSMGSSLNSSINITKSDNEKTDVDKKVDTDVTSSASSKLKFRRNNENTPRIKSVKKLGNNQESARKRAEMKIIQLEKERKREEERENRRREKVEKRKKKEEKEKAEKEQRKKEKKLKDLKKQMEVEQKQKDKEAKEEERRKREEAKEEERRKKEEEKLEAERKQQKAASNFASFFVPKKPESKVTEEENDIETRYFMPFEVKADMRVAPVCRRILSKDEKLTLDEECNSTIDKTSSYLTGIKLNKITIGKSEKTWPFETKEDVTIIEDENDDNTNIVEQTPISLEKHHPKLLQFYENRRPPYWGTWRKQSKQINSRRPFSKDSKWFDYDIDSDDEWEEEEPGESLRGSEDEKDEENPEDNEYDVDNEFMVPHGYLSEEEARADEEEKEDTTPETQKFKLKLLGEQFEAERNAKTIKLRPKIIGCIWQGLDNTFPEHTPSRIVDFLTARQAWTFHLPILLPSSMTESASSENNRPSRAGTTVKRCQVPEEALPDLIRLVHGNRHAKQFLVKEFIAFWCKKNNVETFAISKRSLSLKIKEISKYMPCPKTGPMYSKNCWYVSDDIRSKYLGDNQDLSLPNHWKYTH